jgi:hypothetical protein
MYDYVDLDLDNDILYIHGSFVSGRRRRSHEEYIMYVEFFLRLFDDIISIYCRIADNFRKFSSPIISLNFFIISSRGMAPEGFSC